MTVYRGDCFCRERSPMFVSSELAERWLLDHAAARHPERAAEFRERALRGEFKPVIVGPGGEVVPLDREG